MPEIGPEHPLTYRQELLEPLFQHVRASESAAVVGAASMGKSRLLQFLLQPQVQRHYLGEQSDETLLLWTDCNRLTEVTPWALYELILTALVEAVRGRGRPPELGRELNDLRRDAILGKNALLAQRHLELAIQLLCQEHGLSLCFVLDEFDECLSDLPSQTLASLRALRDANKYQLSYVLFIRDLPAQFRDPLDYEGFYELFSRAILGLKPYSADDALRTLTQVATRRRHELPAQTESVFAELVRLSGGHPGLMVALLDALIHSWPTGQSWEEWALAEPSVSEELRKLWMGLRPKERKGLNQTAYQQVIDFRVRQGLLVKGLLVETGSQTVAFFSPLLATYAEQNAPLATQPLQIDRGAGLVFVNGEQTPRLTSKEFDLLIFLDDRRGEICAMDDILEGLYGLDPSGVESSTVTTLVGRLRKKIEPNPRQPIYLVTQRGRGYSLFVEPV